MKNTNTTWRSGYTLIEILVSVTLSLLLLLGVTQMFRGVGDTINNTQATLNMAANLNSTGIVLRNDLGAIDPALAYKARDLAQIPRGTKATAAGYLEIIEGQGAPPSVVLRNSGTINVEDDDTPPKIIDSRTPGRHIPPHWTAYSPDDPNGDRTVGDTDDILAFTATSGGLYTGLIGNTFTTESNAEVVWFVRGTNLYRRVLLIKGHESSPPTGDYSTNDVSIDNAGDANTLESLGNRRNRFGRLNNSFPFPMYSSTTQDWWYYLRMPTLEETMDTSVNWHNSRPSLNLGTTGTRNGIPMSNFPNLTTWIWGNGTDNQFWNFWEYPNHWVDQDEVTGSLDTYATQGDTRPRNSRAGEDIILTNVIGFDVKVWNPYWVPCSNSKWAPPQFVDLGQDRFYIDSNWENVDYTANLTATGGNAPPYDPDNPNKTNVAGYGFTLKGRYNNIPDTVVPTVRRTLTAGTDKWHEADRIKNVDPDNPNNVTYTSFGGSDGMACVYDSWSEKYYEEAPTIFGLSANDRPDPPYTEPITGIQVTIRCFDPRSGNIRQMNVTRYFEEP